MLPAVFYYVSIFANAIRQKEDRAMSEKEMRPMELGELLPLIDENRTVVIRDIENPECELARYDGKNSIDKEFNGTTVQHINIEDITETGEKNVLVIYTGKRR